MEAFRLTKTGRPDGLDAEGARLYGGRFNSPGTPLLYLASSRALAMLEMRVHAPAPFPAQRLLHRVHVPSVSVKRIEDLGLALPVDWTKRPPPLSTQVFGDLWVASRASLGLFVPSVVVEGEYNLLINPSHADFRKVELMDSTILDLDPRLWVGAAVSSSSGKP